MYTLQHTSVQLTESIVFTCFLDLSSIPFIISY